MLPAACCAGYRYLFAQLWPSLACWLSHVVLLQAVLQWLRHLWEPHLVSLLLWHATCMQRQVAGKASSVRGPPGQVQQSSAGAQQARA
ncbi:hypothetical protein COO60DRAFT_242513 [Scenedesmus sp. NREL 46B-D3]|nr:hypothetical protein COO60DRAFT_242513 [Scenedesmus sp. NREL 46B-D3]